MFDDPKGLFASAPVNAALTKSKSKDSSEKLVGAAAVGVGGCAATVFDLKSLMHLHCLLDVLNLSSCEHVAKIMLVSLAVVACSYAVMVPQSPHVAPQQPPRGPEIPQRVASVC